MADTVGKVNESMQNEKTYDLVCLGFYNCTGTCYLSVTLNCILTMEVTRRAFMNLPDPGSPDYHIPDDSITALIHFFFLKRRRPEIADHCHRRCHKGILQLLSDRIQNWIHWQRRFPDYSKHRETLQHLDRIEKLLHRQFPNYFRGSGGSSAIALHFILDSLR